MAALTAAVEFTIMLLIPVTLSHHDINSPRTTIRVHELTSTKYMISVNFFTTDNNIIFTYNIK